MKEIMSTKEKTMVIDKITPIESLKMTTVTRIKKGINKKEMIVIGKKMINGKMAVGMMTALMRE